MRVARIAGSDDVSDAIAELKVKHPREGVYDCCSVDPKTGICTVFGKQPDWTECSCVGYVKFPGGKQGLYKEVRKIQHGE